MTEAITRERDALLRLIDDGRPKSAIELACYRRLISDLETGHERGLVWDEDEAGRAVKFAGLLRHWKGREWAGRPIVFEPFQAHGIIRPLYAWKRADGTRRFRECFFEFPRKTGKTSTAAVIGLRGLMGDSEPGAEVYCSATKRDQAAILFKDASRFLRGSKLASRLQIMQHSILYPHLDGMMKPLSSEGNTLDGLNTHVGILDELHAHKTPDVYDLINTSMGARDQPLLVSITTAGSDQSPTNICWAQHTYAHDITHGSLTSDGLKDDTFLALVTCAEQGDDIYDPKIWAKANPNLGVSKRLDYMQKEANRAKSSKARENTFRRLDLNQWVDSLTPWLDMDQWDKRKGVLPSDSELRGIPCWGGLDLGNTRDTNALVLCWRVKGKYVFRAWIWIPEDSVSERAHQDRRQILQFAEAGHIRKTPGNTTDYGVIAAECMEIFRRYNVQELRYDSNGPAGMFVQRLQELGFSWGKLKEFRQTMVDFNAPTKEFDRIVSSGEMLHEGNPALRWMAKNTVVRSDASGNERPDKEKSASKIDGIVAAIMSLDGAMMSARNKPKSAAPRGFPSRV